MSNSLVTNSPNFALKCNMTPVQNYWADDFFDLADNQTTVIEVASGNVDFLSPGERRRQYETTCIVVYFCDDETRWNSLNGTAGCVAQIHPYFGHPYQNVALSNWDDERPHWIRVAESRQDALSLKEISEIITEISIMLHDGSWDEVNRGLEVAYVGNMSQDAMIAILRTTFSIRLKIALWSKFLEKCQISLARREVDSSSITRISVAAAS